MANKIFGGFVLLVFTMLVFQDTPEFRLIMRFLVSGNPVLAPPAIWSEIRPFLIGALLFFLLIHYRPSLMRYGAAGRIYANQQPLTQKPVIAPEQAGYIFLRDPEVLMGIRLIQWCQTGLVKLHHGDSPHPWSVSKTAVTADNKVDRRLLETLFKDNNVVTIKERGGSPHPTIRPVTDDLLHQIQAETQPYLPPQSGAALAWLVLLALWIEIPFLHSFNPDLIPGQFFLHFGFAAFTGLVTAGVSRAFPLFFTDGKNFALIAVLFGLFLVVMVRDMTSAITAPYLEITLYIDAATILAVLIQQAPSIPKDPELLKAIVGYKNHLQSKQTTLTEQDLPWLIALRIGTGLYNDPNLNYQKSNPNWLDGDDEDPRKLLGGNPNSLMRQLGLAINGRMKTSGHSHHQSSNSGI